MSLRLHQSTMGVALMGVRDKSHLGHVLAAGQAHLEATGVHQQGHKGKGKGHHHKKYPGNDRHYAMQEKRDGQKDEFRKEYSPQDSTRRAFWSKVKAVHPKLKDWTYLTRMVNEYLKGSYKAKDGLYYDANTGKHKQAMMKFYNAYVKARVDPPLTQWPDGYERGIYGKEMRDIF